MGPPAAIVLCGGQSSRMGQSKAWLEFGQETLLARVVRLAGTVADPLVVVAAAGQNVPPLADKVIIARDARPGRGPLEGLLAGLSALPEQTELAFVTATDAALLNPGWITFLSSVIGDADAAVPFVDGLYHPLAAVYRVSAARQVAERLLSGGRRRLIDLVAELRSRIVSREELSAIDADCPTLRNLNTPGDYAKALREAGFAP